MKKLCPAVLVIALLLPSAAWARPYKATVDLSGGRLDIPGLPMIDLSSAGGWVMVRAINAGMGDSFHITVGPSAAVIEFDTDKLPASWNQTCDALIRFTEVAAPHATARQRAQQGLLLTEAIDPSKPLVIIVHGLDGDASCCADLRDLLHADGKQVAVFAYPAERSLSESSDLLAAQMAQLRHDHPMLKIDLIGESMGGLLARSYVEGPSYVGSVNRLIMIAPPNAGSTWASLAPLSKLAVNAVRMVTDEAWSPSWMITEGICQNEADLQPDSDFLIDLNSLPRRAGVKYTIIAGDLSTKDRVASEMVASLGEAFPRNVIGLSQLRRLTDREAENLEAQRSKGDGPVTLKSASLSGVDDFVIVHADHVALYESVDGQAPAAWETIRSRLDQ